MKKNLKYITPEFKTVKCKSADFITTSGEEEQTKPAWGGEEVIEPDFPLIIL